jgi:uncharacterized protein DUF3800
MEPIYRLFVDEVGHGNMKATDHCNEQYLSLTAVIMGISYERDVLEPALNILKTRIFGTPNIVLHRTEMVYRRPPFENLDNDEVRSDFDKSALSIIENASYRVITVVIDKREHKRRYLVWHAYPYHYCMLALLERYVLWLKSAGSYGDVMAESRGKKDNKKLIESYARLYRGGTDFVDKKLFQQRLSTKELKIKDKRANVAGLQLADLLANPSMRAVICEKTHTQMTAGFGSQIVEILNRAKYRRRFDGVISGVGTKWLP